MPRIRAESIVAHKEASRAAILDAAKKVFLANGYDGASLSAIADVSGIARTTIYEYFHSKGHILLAVIEDRIPPLLESVLAEIEDQPPLEAINQIFTQSIALVVKVPELAELMFRVGRALPEELRNQMWTFLSPITDELYRQCRAGVASGYFAAKHPDRLGRILADMLVSATDELTQEADPKAAAPVVTASRLAFLRGGLSG
ncbi:MAG: TetR/AcrR family transcriptional regulator [bacterium]|nr:TetR/AcrR family transcriptional regulator [bacterium]